ncbi:MAG: lipid A biosynthesis acyltransferase [Alphaproteobacteria bacterium PRO2]|nr:lipid A biosynthesis acyltransferase [Alphaproteobacteria bacterium PRO2]
MKHLRYILEAVVLYVFFAVCFLLPPVAASNLGGFIGRMIGPRLAASRKARRNLDLALPGLPDAEKSRIIVNMWDNLGRVIAEYPHLEKIAGTRVKIVNEDIIKKTIDAGQGAVFIAAHQGNWEIDMTTLHVRFDVIPSLTYRAPNNPMADYLLEHARTLGGRIKAIPKARSSGRDLMNVMKNREYLGILIDQKYHEGIAVDFFGHPAMTNPIAVVLCQKYNAPLIPVQNRRTGPAQFELTAYKPMKIFDDNGEPLPVADVLAEANGLIQDWIVQDPGQWLWLHRRWDLK